MTPRTATTGGAGRNILGAGLATVRDWPTLFGRAAADPAARARFDRFVEPDPTRTYLSEYLSSHATSVSKGSSTVAPFPPFVDFDEPANAPRPLRPTVVGLNGNESSARKRSSVALASGAPANDQKPSACSRSSMSRTPSGVAMRASIPEVNAAISRSADWRCAAEAPNPGVANAAVTSSRSRPIAVETSPLGGRSSAAVSTPLIGTPSTLPCSNEWYLVGPTPM